MLKLDLTPLIHAKGFTQSQAFLRKHGFTAREARTLMNEKSVRLIRDSMIQRLCETFLCEPNDLMSWTDKQNDLFQRLNIGTVPPLHDLMKGKSQAEVQLLLEQLKLELKAKPPISSNGKGRLFMNVRRLIEERQQPHPQRFLELNGFTKMEANKLLDPKRTSIRMKMLSRLCVFFDCLPNELFDWDGSEEHFLNALRKDPVVDLKVAFDRLPSNVVRRLLGS